MDEQLYRKKALDRISSPESLNDYIKAAPMSVWLLLGAVIIFLLGACCWGILGSVDSTVKSVVYIDGDTAYAYVRAENCTELEEGMTVESDVGDFTITEIEDEPFRRSEGDIKASYAAYKLEDDSANELWIYEMVLEPIGEEPTVTGYYSAKIVTESVHPFSFIFN